VMEKFPNSKYSLNVTEIGVKLTRRSRDTWGSVVLFPMRD
jgi:hypothetical protein